MIIGFFEILLVAACLISCDRQGKKTFANKKEPTAYTYDSTRSRLLDWVSNLYLKTPDEDSSKKAQTMESFQQQWDSLFNSPKVLSFKKTKPPPSAEKQIQFLKEIVYQEGQIVFDSSKLELQNVFPHLVWQNKKGNCMGVSLILLAAAKELNIPLFGVHLPGHFFVRFQKGDKKINLEPNRGGFSYSDEEYKKKYSLHPQSPYDLKNLRQPEVAGVFLYNLGSIALTRKNYAQARDFFQASLRHFPELSEAHGNLGLCFNYLQQPDSAEHHLTSALKLNPVSVNAYQNLTGFYLLDRETKKAEHIVISGLRIFPENPGLNYNYALILREQGRDDTADYYFQKARVTH